MTVMQLVFFPTDTMQRLMRFCTTEANEAKTTLAHNIAQRAGQSIEARGIVVALSQCIYDTEVHCGKDPGTFMIELQHEIPQWIDALFADTNLAAAENAKQQWKNLPFEQSE